jgi:hypothetical protein
MSVPEFEEQPFKKLPENSDTSYPFYKLFVDDEFVDSVSQATILYMERKVRPEVQQS